ncbi:MAG: hypothetical protein R6U19_09050 [Bacteroidales bacterium]
MMGCESQVPVSADKSEPSSMEMPGQAASMLNLNAPFPVLNQGFNNNLTPWVDKSVAGKGGWWGNIALTSFKESGMKRSAGKGFALVSNDICNVFWNGVWSSFGPFPDGQAFTSGPASGPNPDLLRSTFPESGFVQELDIYLDPEFPSGVSTPIFDPEGAISLTEDDNVVFTYANSVCLSCEPGPDFLPLYFAISVVKDGDDL